MTDHQISVSEHLQVFIKKILKDFEIVETKSLSVKQATKPGDNWFGQILEINIVGTKILNKEEEISIIAKLAPSMKTYRDFYPIRSIYKREIYMYNVVLPELVKFQKNHKAKYIFSPFAQCYGTCDEDRQEMILMQDMNKCGYISVSRQHPVDYEHASVTIKSCAKLHAASFALRSQNPNLFEELSAYTKISTGVPESLLPVVVNIATKILNGFEKNSETYRALEKFIKQPHYLINELLQAESAGEYAVITHGDYQIRNILFKYENESSLTKPTDLCILDWQLSIFGSPCLDISLFIWVCTDKRFRDQYYQELIDLYYDTFSSFLREVGGDPEELYPRSVLQNHLKKFSLFGLVWAMFNVAGNLANFSSEPYSTYEISNALLLKIFTTIADETYFARMYENVNDYVEYGYKLSDDV